MIRRLSTWGALAALCVATMLAGGGVANASGSQSTPQSRSTSAQAREMDDMRSDINTALYVVNRFWATHWSRHFTGRYYPPNIFGGYSRSGKAAPYCGYKQLTYNNAYYCPNGHYIAWDTDLMRRGYREGDAWVYDIIAHEWGHAVQATLDESLRSRAAELQADCLAGAALYGAAADGTLLFEDGDVEEIADAYQALGDRLPWTKPGDHGTPRQRIAAFNRGADHGINGCF
ncbi:hypothetical protein Sme01_74360 [Sphaerisporangium melleum]|uniref:Metalloprotease n=1 Tax=Sphaerisporangium melleum TaxID=321316 RepID=A0A917R417_9ACTN|nr:neutral zinc metallopeptidase [Sphaerisporangium melleum]GGK87931.1 hypothetical protein GCM10007964_33070 [Sphaerisporangium melleum]GII74960.1 hypothetical protein Sme01_74360 [Sphaerisporangium melleum]